MQHQDHLLKQETQELAEIFTKNFNYLDKTTGKRRPTFSLAMLFHSKKLTAVLEKKALKLDQDLKQANSAETFMNILIQNIADIYTERFIHSKPSYSERPSRNQRKYFITYTSESKGLYEEEIIKALTACIETSKEQQVKVLLSDLKCRIAALPKRLSKKVYDNADNVIDRAKKRLAKIVLSFLDKGYPDSSLLAYTKNLHDKRLIPQCEETDPYSYIPRQYGSKNTVIEAAKKVDQSLLSRIKKQFKTLLLLKNREGTLFGKLPNEMIVSIIHQVASPEIEKKLTKNK